MEGGETVQNPYLAHRAANDQHVDPLSGFQPRQVSAKQVTAALNGAVNPFTKRPHSQRYKDILKKRNALPVAGKMAEFLEVRRDTDSSDAAGLPEEPIRGRGRRDGIRKDDTDPAVRRVRGSGAEAESEDRVHSAEESGGNECGEASGG